MLVALPPDSHAHGRYRSMKRWLAADACDRQTMQRPIPSGRHRSEKPRDRGRSSARRTTRHMRRGPAHSANRPGSALTTPFDPFVRFWHRPADSSAGSHRHRRHHTVANARVRGLGPCVLNRAVDGEGPARALADAAGRWRGPLGPSHSRIALLKATLGARRLLAEDYGRDARYRAPPAQIRTCPIRAFGSYLGCLTANRWSGHG